jgi:hypothetical protein
MALAKNRNAARVHYHRDEPLTTLRKCAAIRDKNVRSVVSRNMRRDGVEVDRIEFSAKSGARRLWLRWNQVPSLTPEELEVYGAGLVRHIHLKRQVKGSMRNIKAAALLALLFGLGLISSAHAHHGYAAYDLEKTVTVSGTVDDVLLGNPHSSVGLQVKDEKGTPTHWSFEFGNLRSLLAEGWTKDTLKSGDEIKVSVHPAKNGAHVGVLVGKISYSDGRPLPLNAPKE